jgi:hypothetical protein
VWEFSFRDSLGPKTEAKYLAMMLLLGDGSFFLGLMCYAVFLKWKV